MVEHNITGIVIPPRDPKALGKAILELLKDSRKRTEFSMNAKSVSENALSWSRLSLLICEIYQKVPQIDGYP